ncbi:hypothetical protein NE686_09640 [Tissierella carlieri]|jgi:hypothetical protein|uniref:Uncharacterized protein n=1 Tax=Tissierella carlieri TaxID=689904 RepID=A0ABT1SAI1_9FIRM|nr:hypothetical protein [Tissierella carlieri]MCQ4923347.1 hypothetical protein [Tissierella carlieri]
MNRKLFDKTKTRLLGLIAFIATGGGLIISTAANEENFYKTEILIIFGCFFAISLADHFRKLIERDDKSRVNKRDLYVLMCSFIGVTLTWFINHKMGYGPVIANGLVGVMAAIFLPNDLAGITYTSSFVGMSSLVVIPSMAAAALGSLIVGLILLATAEIYAGIGGKGGTTAALSTIITKTIMRIFS